MVDDKMTTIDDIDTYKFMVSNWPEVISLYHPPSSQMTLPEKAMCRSVQTFLIMNKKKIKYEERTNAEYMSPNSKFYLYYFVLFIKIRTYLN